MVPRAGAPAGCETLQYGGGRVGCRVCGGGDGELEADFQGGGGEVGFEKECAVSEGPDDQDFRGAWDCGWCVLVSFPFPFRCLLNGVYLYRG